MIHKHISPCDKNCKCVPLQMCESWCWNTTGSIRYLKILITVIIQYQIQLLKHQEQNTLTSRTDRQNYLNLTSNKKNNFSLDIKPGRKIVITTSQFAQQLALKETSETALLQRVPQIIFM